MTSTRTDERACQLALAKLDSYMDRELTDESRLELTEHLAHCNNCAQEAEHRRNSRRRLSIAVRTVPVPAQLKERIRKQVKAAGQPRLPYFHMMAVAATVAVCFGAIAMYRPGDDSYIGSLSKSVPPILRVGLGDHLHCAVLRRHVTPKPTAVNLPVKYAGLLAIATKEVPSGYGLISAHECRYQTRKYVHLTFSNARELISLVVARKQDGETLTGLPHTASAEQFQVAAFETRDYLIYTVSDMSERRNRELLTALRLPLELFFNRSES